MKSLLSYLIMGVLLIGSGSLSYAEAGPNGTVIKFYKASKNGDVETMKHLIAGQFYNSRKVLLNENRGYPTFLRKYYGGSKMQVVYTVIGNDPLVKKNHPKLYERHYRKTKIRASKNVVFAVVGVKHLFKEGSNIDTKLLLMKDNNDIWHIVDEILAD
jgi:hypothetical protein